MDLGDRLVAERRARLAAERLLELKSRELFAANRKLSEHARVLSDEIVVQRRVVETAQTAAEALKGENVRVRSDLHEATAARTTAEHRLYLALETIRDGFAIYDSATRLVMANGAYMSVFDGLEEVGPGAHARDILRIGLEEGVFDPGHESPDAWIEGMLARWRGDVIETRVIRLWNGRYIRLVDRRGGDGGIVSLALDITGMTRREQQLRVARARAEAANRAKSAFLANMSHELRTPMNGVVGMAELLTETPMSEEQRLYAETIKSSGEALLLIINDVLDYSKLEAERLELRAEAFDLERLVHEVAMVLSPSATEKKLSLAIEVDPALPARLVGDRGRLRQVLTNLAGNAVKFTEKGHVAIRVAGAAAAPGRQRITVAVEDTGIGIAPEMAEHVFGEFNQVEDERNRKFEGTGLGLAISRQLVRLMGGDIWLDSTAGQGSCFTFVVDLPVAEAAPERPPALDTFRCARVIDADPVGRALLCRQLEALGIAAEPLAAAADATPGQRPDVIFADVAATEAAAVQDAAGAPVVFHTSSRGAAADALATGRFAAVLVRPALRQELFAALATAARAPMALPAAAPRASEDRRPTAPAGPDAAGQRRLRVLAAEDNRTNQLVFSKMLKDFALDITFAGNGREALDAFGPLNPDIVFMDISMPEMDGKEATRRIRAFEAEGGLPRTPIVALTAHALEGDQSDILAAGLDRYLTKPLKKSAIIAAFEELLPGRFARSESSVELASGTGG